MRQAIFNYARSRDAEDRPGKPQRPKQRSPTHRTAVLLPKARVAQTADAISVAVSAQLDLWSLWVLKDFFLRINFSHELQFLVKYTCIGVYDFSEPV